MDKQQGEAAENRIKEWKTIMAADQLSCHGFWANWFRLVRQLRARLANTAPERACPTIQLKLLKVGAWVGQTARRLWVHVAAGYPYRFLWIHLHARLCAG